MDVSGVVLTAVTGVTIKGILQEVLKPLFEKIGDFATARKIKEIERIAGRLYLEAKKVRMVKTLGQVDKAVDLESFYCAPHLLIGNARKKINRLSDIGDSPRVVITGTAGQGKSIFLRFLCSSILREGTFIPIFVELRTIPKGLPVYDFIKKAIQLFGFPEMDKVLFDKLLAAERIILLLDGLDEVQESEKRRIVVEIENLVGVFGTLRVIVTSRPEGVIEPSPFFERVRLDGLVGREYKEIIDRISVDSTFAQGLVAQIEVHRGKIAGLLCTPLLVTLLVIQYKAYQTIPAQMSDFYDSIFQLLLQRHDGSKPGYLRQRKCSFNDSQYRKIFEMFCFLSKKRNIGRFSLLDVESDVEQAITHLKLNNGKAVNRASNYVSDVINVTCLLLQEGGECRFIHKSVQEYYVSAYIKSRPDNTVKQFYQKLLLERSRRWEQELEFLREIDNYRFTLYYEIPLLCSILKCVPDQVPEAEPQVSVAWATEMLGTWKIGFDLSDATHFRTSHFTGFLEEGIKDFQFENDLHRFLFETNFLPCVKAIKDKVIPSVREENQIVGPVNVIEVRDLLSEGIMRDEFCGFAQKIIKGVYQVAITAKKRLKQEEDLRETTLDFNGF